LNIALAVDTCTSLHMLLSDGNYILYQYFLIAKVVHSLDV